MEVRIAPQLSITTSGWFEVELFEWWQPTTGIEVLGTPSDAEPRVPAHRLRRHVETIEEAAELLRQA